MHIKVPIELHTLGEEAPTHSTAVQDYLHRHRKQMCLLLLNEIKQVAISPCGILNTIL